MKIGIVSDTHDHVERTAKAVAALVEGGAEVLIHCGDITNRAIVLECGGLPSYYVFGNNDYDHNELGRAIRQVVAHETVQAWLWDIWARLRLAMEADAARPGGRTPTSASARWHASPRS